MLRDDGNDDSDSNKDRPMMVISYLQTNLYTIRNESNINKKKAKSQRRCCRRSLNTK